MRTLMVIMAIIKRKVPDACASASDVYCDDSEDGYYDVENVKEDKEEDDDDDDDVDNGDDDDEDDDDDDFEDGYDCDDLLMVTSELMMIMKMIKTDNLISLM